MGDVALHGLEDREQARQASAAQGSDGAFSWLALNLGAQLEALWVLGGGWTGTYRDIGLVGSLGWHLLVCLRLWICREFSSQPCGLLLLVTWRRVHWCGWCRHQRERWGWLST